MATLFKGLSVTILLIALIVTSFHGAQGEDQQLESQCRPYVEKALKEQLQDAGDVPLGSAGDDSSGEDDNKSGDDITKNSLEDFDQKDDDGSNETVEKDESGEKENESLDVEDSKGASAEETVSAEDEPASVESAEKENEEDTENKSAEEESKSSEETTQEETDADAEETEAITATENDSTETAEVTDEDTQEEGNSKEDATPLGKEEDDSKSDETKEEDVQASDSVEDTDSVEGDDSSATADTSVEDKKESDDDQQENETVEVNESNSEESQETKEDLAESDDKNASQEDSEPSEKSGEGNDGSSEEETATSIEEGGENETKEESSSEKSTDDQVKDDSESSDSKETEETVESKASEESNETLEATETDDTSSDKDSKEDATEEKPTEDDSTESGESDESHPEDDLLLEIDIPDNLRSRDHVTQILRFDDEFAEKDLLLEKSADIILRELKRIYDNSIKPLEILYRYRDLSNRHFGDPEIFSKPLVLFMGPWSGGKSSIINYLTDNEYTSHTLRTGAEPSPAYFNILMHGEVPEVLDGTQLAADWTFSGLQKFGQGLEDRLRGLKLPNKLLEKINIVEIPGILEVRKQVSRLFPFNDACQWFIDRADIIFLVYDPSKLDVGPETEAILDQLKGREYQTRIILNKADQVKPEELMRVQGALIWNISPLMSSAQPPIMYTTSLWSSPYEVGAPARLLHAQEIGFLKDLRSAIDKRIENKIASARRFAVRVRNHAKMVDCYLTTYYNHKSLFGNKKIIANTIIEHPQDYHIYEGLSTLTNISRYDLPDPDVYKDFFKLNPLYDFQQLAATCTYFRGCPINKLDVAIAYDLPELVGKYKKMVESASGSDDSKTNSNS